MDKNYISYYIKCDNCKDFFIEVGYNLNLCRVILKLNYSKEKIDLQHIKFNFDDPQIKYIFQ